MLFSIQKDKQVSAWVKHESGAEFLINGIKNREYLIAEERAQHAFRQQGVDLSDVSTTDRPFHEYLLEATAKYLIADWSGVQIKNEDGEIIDVPFSKDTAFQILRDGDIGIVLWAFVKKHAEKIQSDAEKVKTAIVGKSENSTSGQKTPKTAQARKPKLDRPVESNQN